MGHRVDLQILTQRIPRELGIENRPIGLPVSSVGTATASIRTINKLENIVMLQSYPFGEKLCIEMLIFWVVKREGTLLDELMCDLVANQIRRNISPVFGERKGMGLSTTHYLLTIYSGFILEIN